MKTFWIKDPLPVWDKIRRHLADDSGALDTQGPFVGVEIGGEPAGAFSVKPLNDHCYQIHGGVHPGFWGRGAQVCDAMGVFLFNTTPCLKIVAIIPAFNRLMIACVKELGMTQEGVLSKSFMKGFKMHDQIVFGMTKGERRCLHQQQ